MRVCGETEPNGVLPGHDHHLHRKRAVLVAQIGLDAARISDGALRIVDKTDQLSTLLRIRIEFSPIAGPGHQAETPRIATALCQHRSAHALQASRTHDTQPLSQTIEEPEK
jgi:hypothetical protein